MVTSDASVRTDCQVFSDDLTFISEYRKHVTPLKKTRANMVALQIYFKKLNTRQNLKTNEKLVKCKSGRKEKLNI